MYASVEYCPKNNTEGGFGHRLFFCILVHFKVLTRIQLVSDYPVQYYTTVLYVDNILSRYCIMVWVTCKSGIFYLISIDVRNNKVLVIRQCIQLLYEYGSVFSCSHIVLPSKS